MAMAPQQHFAQPGFQPMSRGPSHLAVCPPNAPMSRISLWMAVPLNVSLAPSASSAGGRVEKHWLGVRRGMRDAACMQALGAASHQPRVAGKWSCAAAA